MQLDAALSKVDTKSFTDIALFGDFNAHIDWWQHDEPIPKDAADDSLLDIVTSANLHQVCQLPSYASQGQSSFLDLVFVRNISRVTSCQVLPCLTGSEHSAIELSYATTLPRKGHFARTRWNFGMARLAHLAPGCLTTGNDCSENYDLWCKFVQAIQADCVPLSTSTARRRRPPWISLELATRKQALFRRAARRKCPVTLQKAKELQHSLKATIQMAHDDYARNIALRAKENPKLFWAYINRLQATAHKPCFMDSAVPVTEPSSIAQLFASQFSSTYSSTTSLDPRPPRPRGRSQCRHSYILYQYSALLPRRPE